METNVLQSGHRTEVCDVEHGQEVTDGHVGKTPQLCST